MRIWGAVVLTLALLAAPAAASPQDVANDVARNIMSPYCPGVTLHDCTSSEALALRDRIEGWAAAGMTRGQITDRLEDEFGPVVRATPPREGSGWIAWLLPLVAVAAGAALAWWLASRWAARERGETSPPPEVSDTDRARLDAELERMRTEL